MLLLGLVGLILVGGGIFFYRSGLNFSGTKVEVLNSSDSLNPQNSQTITAEISGEVITPGVYKLADGSRIDDLLVAAGGFSGSADRVWTDKYLNRAAKITDGQKIYIPHSGELSAKSNGEDQTISTTNSTDSNTLINVNTASLSQLDSLPDIAQKRGQSIIEHRPYSTLEELVSKGAINQNLYNKIKDKISIY